MATAWPQMCVLCRQAGHRPYRASLKLHRRLVGQSTADSPQLPFRQLPTAPPVGVTEGPSPRTPRRRVRRCRFGAGGHSKQRQPATAAANPPTARRPAPNREQRHHRHAGGCRRQRGRETRIAASPSRDTVHFTTATGPGRRSSKNIPTCIYLPQRFSHADDRSVSRSGPE